MDMNINDHKGVGCSSKRARTSDESKDFVSDLPDEILVHILSFLPITDAINTVLLRRFGNLWRRIQVLDFDDMLYNYIEDPDDRPYHNESFVNFIRHVLNLHNSIVLDKLCLKFDFTTPCLKGIRLQDDDEAELEWEKGTSDLLEKLIRYAIGRKVKVLDLDLRYTVYMDAVECYDLPDVLCSNYLTHLNLTAVSIMFCTTIDLKWLKVLSLDEVSLDIEIMEKVLDGCPLLEDLSLIHCYGLKWLVCGNPNLKKVMLNLTDRKSDFLLIACPYVLSLEIYGQLERAFLLRASSLVDASIFYLHGFKQEQYRSIHDLLQRVRKCKTFSSCTWTILVFTIWNFTNLHCPSFEWKNLILKLSLTKWHHPGLSLLLKNSQSLETLTMHIYPSTYWADMYFKKPWAKWIEAYEFDVDKYWDSQEATFPCLETITICGYVNEPHVLQMVKFLLRSATRLQKLVISTQKSFKPIKEENLTFDVHIKKLPFQFTSEQLQELSEKFKSLPRASPEAMAKWIESYEFDIDKFWDSQQPTFPNLKTIMIYGYVNEPYVIEMVTFLLRNATNLQKLVISISTQISFRPSKEEIQRLEFQFASEQLQELSGKFKSLPRTSPVATIYFS